MKISRIIFTTCLSVGLSACNTLQTKPAAVIDTPITGPFATENALAAHDNLNAVAWMQASLEYRLLAGQTWRSGLLQLDRAIKSPNWDALVPAERDKPVKGLPMAVIVDIDETVLDNSSYQARLIRDGKLFADASWDAWVKEEAALAIPGAVEFTRAADARGVKIFYISNRADYLKDATLNNLRKLGFPIANEQQFLGKGTQVAHCVNKGSEKTCRRMLVSREYRVLLQFGDQLGDMVTITDNSRAGRELSIKPYLNWIGERWFVLPNPSYGSWEPALFNNAWSKSETERREMKYKSLRY
jgi:5'-nucleotidase (lipoprotein e(P4) family)